MGLVKQRRLANDEARELRVFLHGLPERVREDAHAIRVFAALFAELYELPAEHVIRHIAAQSEAQ